jgi:hypothetical protein
VIESLDNGKSIRESRDCDVPLVVRHFYHHAGWAQLMDHELPDWKSLGQWIRSRGVPRGASKGEEDGRRPPALWMGHPSNGHKAVLGVAHPPSVEG